MIRALCRVAGFASLALTLLVASAYAQSAPSPDQALAALRADVQGAR